MGRPAIEIVGNQTIKMKVFCFLGALVPLIAGSFATETEFYAYVTVASEVRASLHSVSSSMITCDHQVLKLSHAFHWNVSRLRSQYGLKTSSRFYEKYKIISDDFAKNQTIRRECSQYVANLLVDNQKHRIEVEQYLNKAVHSWTTELEKIYKELADLRVKSSNLETELYQCGLLTGDSKAPFNCAINVLDRAKRIDSYAMVSVVLAVGPSLQEVLDKTLVKLNQAMNASSIPFFYDERRLDQWLGMSC